MSLSSNPINNINT